MLHVRWHLFHEVYLFFLPDTETCLYDIIAIFCLWHYSFLSVMKINVWHSIKRCIIDALNVTPNYPIHNIRLWHWSVCVFGYDSGSQTQSPRHMLLRVRG